MPFKLFAIKYFDFFLTDQDFIYQNLQIKKIPNGKKG